ncbi:heavy-metal-associated domain-containing protein [Nitrosococcus watsonii]|uniref:Heavy metal transport/detoxification protein n=1 Tax=Nitrosococcus watsoni (strain C-113) TaxID=105559 RepID=D8KBL0_NITWC|nr:heavy metal-associated domain-containing protein [Nitrosococcus watsonii]ADJ29657.1 Heavy metal transport/detoxification protein [Nitrosococcus watsonii C-113]
MEKTYKVEGMTCGACAQSVEKAISGVAPTATVKVDLENNQVTVTGVEDDNLVAQAVEDAGFDYEGPVF